MNEEECKLTVESLLSGGGEDGGGGLDAEGGGAAGGGGGVALGPDPSRPYRRPLPRSDRPVPVEILSEINGSILYLLI